MQIPKNIQIILIMIIEAALCGLFYVYVYTPTNAEIARLEAEVERMRRDKREIELTKKLLAETRKENERLRTEIEHLERFFPEELYIPTVLLQIEHLALATQLDISKITPKGTAVQRADEGPAGAGPAPAGAPTPAAAQSAAQAEEKKYAFDSNKEYKKSIIDFDVSGNYQAIYNFLSELTTFPKLVVIESLAITSEGKKGGEKESAAGNLKISMPLTFYIQQKTTPLVLKEGEEENNKSKGLIPRREFDETKANF